MRTWMLTAGHGSRIIQTPHIDRIANEGVRLSNGYANAGGPVMGNAGHHAAYRKHSTGLTRKDRRIRREREHLRGKSSRTYY